MAPGIARAAAKMKNVFQKDSKNKDSERKEKKTRNAGFHKTMTKNVTQKPKRGAGLKKLFTRSTER